MERIFINPGHAPNGIPDPGAVNRHSGTKESDIALDVATRVVEYLKKVGLIVEILQSDSLAEICNESDNFGATIFVSIHANCSDGYGSARGTETFHMPGSIYGRMLADCIQKQIINSLETIDRGVKQKAYYVLKNTNTAYSALVEMEFIDNDDACQFMLDNADDYARAIARGITDYIRKSAI